MLGWYVLVHTGSVLWLTVFGSLQFLGTLAAPVFGVLGDRLGARFMLCAMRAAYAGLATILMVLAVTGRLTPAWVLVLATLVGLVRPNDLVMRNTLIGETIAVEHLVGALGLSRATTDSARVAGALAGAGLSTALGLGVTYACVVSFYAASLVLTFGVSRRLPVPDPTVSPRARAAAEARASGWRDLKDGLAHVAATPALLAFMWLAFLVNLTAYPVSNGLLPYVAKHVYLVDATGLGLLVASFSLGGLLASTIVVVTGGWRHPERTTLVCTAVWYLVLLGFAHVRSLGGGILLLVAAGFVQNMAMIAMTVTLLAAAGNRFRSRVMGVRMLAVYGLPLGLMAAGALIEGLGYPLTVAAYAGIGLVLTVFIGARWRASIWRRRPLGAEEESTSLPQRA